MTKNSNQSSNFDITSDDKSPMESRSLHMKIAVVAGLVVGVLTIWACAFFFLKKMPDSVTVQSSYLRVGLALFITLIAAAWFWVSRTGREKTELTTTAKSAGYLQQINEQLQKEIAERIIAEDQARLKGEKDSASIAAKREFLASMSHEIRTPMNAIIGFGDILSEEDLTEQQSGFAKNILDSAEDLLTIINDILDFSKIEAGKMDTEIIDCSLVTLFKSVELMMQPMAAQKGLEFKVNINPTMPKVIRTDPVRVRQCLINLTNNAIKFTKKGYVHVNVSVFEKNTDRFVRFDVEDTGIGIPSDKLDKIFRSFTQVDVSHTREYGGTGLGLAITKKLAKLLEGFLTVTSQVGKGTVFTLSIPLKTDETAREVPVGDSCGKSENFYTESTNEQISGRVLVAEDSHASQTLVKILLERMGLEVAIAEDGKMALSKVLSESFDLVLMDIQMPNMNGYEATKAIREKGIDVPIVALTAHVMKGDDEKCLAAGCDGYLAKPVNRQKLDYIIHKYLGQKIIDESSVSYKDRNEKEICLPISEPKNNSQGSAEDGPVDELTINWENAIRFCDDEKVIGRVANSIIEDGSECLNAIADAIESNDSRKILLYAHRLRGSALTIGIELLAEAAGKVEDAARDGNVILAASYVDALRCEYQRTAEFLCRDDWMEISMTASCHQGDEKEPSSGLQYDN